MEETFTLKDMERLQISSRPKGEVFAHPDWGLDTHNWNVYLSSRGRFKAGVSTFSEESSFLKTSFNPRSCGLPVRGISRDCLSLLRSCLASSNSKFPPNRIHRAHLFSRKESSRLFLEGPQFSRDEFLTILWTTSASVLCLKEENHSLEDPENFKRLSMWIPNEIIYDDQGNAKPRWFPSTPSSFCYGKAEKALIMSDTLITEIPEGII